MSRTSGRRATTSARDSKAKSFLEWIAPPEGVEALAAGKKPELLEGVAEAHWTTDEDVERARETVSRLERDEPLSPEDSFIAEAIILPNERPVVDVVNGTYDTPPAPFKHLGKKSARARIQAALPAIGRVELPDHPSLPYGGTGFVVGDDLLMTNRHVAELFATGLGRETLSFIPGQSAAVDFLRERDRPESLLFQIRRVAMVHPYWDMALLVVDGLTSVTPLSLSTAPPEDLRERDVVVVGYPALDPRNAVDVQNRIFAGVFNVKRLQPGRLRDVESIRSFGHPVAAVTHDSSTLGGNSGSAVVDVKTGEVVGLHFAGVYLEANYAVPTHELALDRRVVEAGVNFDGEIAGDAATPWDSFWHESDAEAPTTTIRADTLPIEITIQIRSGESAAAAGVEALVEPIHDDDFSNRRGYDDRFLGERVPMPKVVDRKIVSKHDSGAYRLPYEHFTVVMSKDAAARAVHRVERGCLPRAKDAGAWTRLHQGRTRRPARGQGQGEVVHRPADPGDPPAPERLLRQGPRVLRQGPHREARGRRMGHQLRRGAPRERRHLPRDELLPSDRQLQSRGLRRPVGRAGEPGPQAG